MTADRANGAADDLELLADYAAGLLDGSPRGAALAARLRHEPELARLHQALTSADSIIRAELRALPAVTMPADLAADLDALLAAEPPLAAPSLVNDHAEVVPFRPRHTWLAKASAVAAGIAVLGGLGVGAQTLLSATNTKSSAGRQSAVSEAGAPASRNAYADEDTATGTHYTAAALTTQVSALVNRSKRSDLAASPTSPGLPWTSSLLDSCLQALGYAGRVLALDFASYEGNPALVVVARGDAQQAEVAVVGPECGRGGTDERARTTVQLSR